MKQERFEDLISKFSKAKVAVLGDFFLDLYIQLDRSLSEFSLETHKEAFQAVDIRGQPGTAGVVINNLSALGAQTAAIASIGSDGNGYTLRKELEVQNTNIDFLIEYEDRFTPTYTKPMMQELDGHNIELNRMDIINRSPNSHSLNLALANNVRNAIEVYDGILVAEQIKMDGYGTMSTHLRDVSRKLAQNYPQKIIIVDTRHFAAAYQGVSLKMNFSEAAEAVHALDRRLPSIDQEEKVSASELYAQAFWNAHQKPVYITLGAEGISGMSNGNYFHHPGYDIDGPIDIVGAGDSVLAGIGLAMCVGATPQEAAYIGNLVGSITVEQIGTTGVATQASLRQRFQEYQTQTKNRIK